MKKIHINSLDKILKWMDVEYDPCLPDPETYPERYIVLPDMEEINRYIWDMKDLSKIPENCENKRIIFRREIMTFEGRFLYVWVRER